MKNLYKILVVAFLFNSATTQAQVGLNLNNSAAFSIPVKTFNDSLFPFMYKNGTQPLNQLKGFSLQNNRSSAFPKTYEYDDLAFFCRVEVKLEKATKFPVKFRLGDVNYVDQLEGKGYFDLEKKSDE